jgi:hypothetical protein
MTLYQATSNYLQAHVGLNKLRASFQAQLAVTFYFAKIQQDSISHSDIMWDDVQKIGKAKTTLSALVVMRIDDDTKQDFQSEAVSFVVIIKCLL